MGRLQKKKSSAKTKKKNRGDRGLAGPKTDTGVNEKKALTAVPSQKETPVRPAEPQRKKSVVSKLVTDNHFIGKSLQFLREVKVELKKVTWPSRKQTMGSTLVVIILVMIISLFLGVVDVGLSGIIRAVLQ